MSISIVVPCFNEQEALPFFYKEFKSLTTKMSYEDFELIFVDDGSRDKTLDTIKDIAKNDTRIKYISFSLNFATISLCFCVSGCTFEVLRGIPYI